MTDPAPTTWPTEVRVAAAPPPTCASVALRMGERQRIPGKLSANLALTSRLAVRATARHRARMGMASALKSRNSSC